MVQPVKSVLLVMVDGMRPDGLMAANAPVMQRLARQGASTLRSRTIMPSVTLPCHTSLFYGVPPGRHGITDNTWHPMARPVASLFDVVWRAGRSTAMFYNWGELRDMAAPSSLAESYLVAAERTKGDESDQRTFERAAAWIRATEGFGFVFAYYGSVDIEGHASGWMSDAYLRRIADADRAVGRLVEAMPDQGLIIVTADHGGHEKTHGTESDEDMTVPLIAWGKAAAAGTDLGQTSILDLAPTIAAYQGLARPPEWEGRVLDLGNGLPELRA
jgi:arylsulfatase A-like enzyme